MAEKYVRTSSDEVVKREVANGILRKEKVHSTHQIVSMTVDVLLNKVVSPKAP
jgi:hypothetical protein